VYHNNLNDILFGVLASDGYFSNSNFGTVNSFNIWDDGFPGGGNYWGYQTVRKLQVQE